MLPSSKSPSRRRAVPFLAASRSISAWGETTASGPSAPSEGDFQAPGASGRTRRACAAERGALMAAAPRQVPPQLPSLRPVLPLRPSSPELHARVGHCGWRADLDFARRGSSPPPTRSGRQRRLPLRRGRGPGPCRRAPASPAGSAGPGATSASPSPPGARVSAAAHPGELPAARSAAPAAADKPADASPGRPRAPKSDGHTSPHAGGGTH